LRIAFLGLPLAALLLANDGHEIAFAGVLPANGARRLARRTLPGRVRLSPDLSSDAVYEALRELRPQLLVSWFWPKPVPVRVLDLVRCVGVHPSLLPRHRGPDPYFWALDAGDPVTGVTAHILDERYDTGPILAQRTLPIEAHWNAWQLARALDRPSLSLLREVVLAFAANRAPPPLPQDDSHATAAPQPTEQDLALDWTWPAERIARRVRAAAPWPGAWTEIGDELVILVQARRTSDFPRALAPGEAAVRADGTAVVRAGEDAIELLAGRAEDDETPLARRDFARIVERARLRARASTDRS